MKTALISLVLLGTKASGCHLRGGSPAGPVGIDNGGALVLPKLRYDDVLEKEASPWQRRHEGIAKTKQTDWRAERKKLMDTCSEDAITNHCTRGPQRGAAVRMARCLSTGPVVSDECQVAIKDWNHMCSTSRPMRGDTDSAEEMAGEWQQAMLALDFIDVGDEMRGGFPAHLGVLPLDELFIAEADRVRHSHESAPAPRHHDRPFGPVHRFRDGGAAPDDGAAPDVSTDNNPRHVVHGRTPPEHGRHGRDAPPGRGPPGRGLPGHRHPDGGHPDSVFSVLVDWLGGGPSSDSSVSSDSWSSDSSDSSSSDSSDSRFANKNGWSDSSEESEENFDTGVWSATGPFGNGRLRGRPSHSRFSGGEVTFEEHVPRPHGGFHEHNNRHNRGDHLRFRNRLPDEYEEPQWFDDLDLDRSFDVVEATVAFFFFIGAFTLMVLPFILLARSIKRMVIRARRSHSSAASPPGPTAAPEGYQALLDDASDDDAVVVTGTPVNPPPSVHI